MFGPEAQLLELLDEHGEATGRQLGELVASRWVARTVYVWLGLLVDRGLVNCRPDPSDVWGRIRFTITQQGKQALDDRSRVHETVRRS